MTNRLIYDTHSQVDVGGQVRTYLHYLPISAAAHGLGVTPEAIKEIVGGGECFYKFPDDELFLSSYQYEAIRKLIEYGDWEKRKQEALSGFLQEDPCPLK